MVEKKKEEAQGKEVDSRGKRQFLRLVLLAGQQIMNRAATLPHVHANNVAGSID
jgi:hypothetical protein